MFELTSGLPFAILFSAGLLALLVPGEGAQKPAQKIFVILAISLALLADLGWSLASGHAGETAGVVFSAEANRIFGATVLLIGLLGQMSQVFEKKDFTREAAALQIFFIQICYSAVTTNNLMVLSLLVPGILLSQWFAPLITGELAPQRRDLMLPLIQAAALFMMFLFATVIWMRVAGTVQIDALIRTTPEANSKDEFVLAWGFLGAAILGMFFLTLWPASLKDVERVGRWSLIIQFQHVTLIAAGILALKWMRLGAAPTVWPEGVYHVGLYLFLGVSMLLLIAQFLIQRTIQQIAVWGCLPLSFLALSGLSASPSDQSVYTGMYVLTSLVLSCATLALLAAGANVNSTQAELWNRLRAAPAVVRGGLLVCVCVMLPLGSLMGFQTTASMLRSLQDQTLTWAIVLGLSALYLGEGYALLRLFYSEAEQKTDASSAARGPIFCLYFVLIPVIFLGIYPSPLYNYFRLSLAGIFIGR